MKALPPLPLVEGALLIDNSALEAYQTCPRATEYGFIRKRRLAVERAPLIFGGAVHEALKVRYTIARDLNPNGEVRAQMQAALQQAFADRPVSEGYRNLDLAQKVITKYNDTYGLEAFKVFTQKEQPMVEAAFTNFLAEIRGIKVYYIGRLDLPVIESGELWNWDHKTTSIYGSTFWDDMSMSAQQRGYCWTLWKKTGQMPKGYGINAIRIRKPTKADQLEPSGGIRSDDFQRQRFAVTKEMLLEWEKNTIALVDEMLYHYELDFMPQKRKWCVGKYGRCQFFDVCTMPHAHRDTILESNLYEPDTWTPLNEPA